MKKVSLFMCAALLGMMFVSCGSSKEVAKAPEKQQECNECLSTKDAIRVEGSFMAQFENQFPKAKQAARNNARQELARIMKTKIESVVEDYSSTYIDGDAQDFKQSVKDLSRSVVDQTVSGAVPIKEWSEKMEKGTMFYSCVELSSNNILDEIKNKVSNDSKLRTDFEYEKFKQVFDKEMEKISE
ncbi:MAG: hypothetical protein IKS65_06235 [Bacteroidales bacterium]|nr:hypothetical protein [Bacteroidales bacterium]